MICLQVEEEWSLGFELANYDIVFAVEKDECGSETYSFNLPEILLITKDITTIDKPRKLL